MKRLFSLLILLYQNTLSVILSVLFGKGCRFTPTCSEYARDAIGKYGIIQGSLKTGIRLSHCHPWGGSGYDPA